MAKKKNELDQFEIEFIKQRESVISSILDSLTEVSKFRTGDFLIAYLPASTYSKRELSTNSYGAPRKFYVLHTDKHNIPYIKELNKNGKPAGQLICPVKVEAGNRLTNSSEYEFEVDPDYADAIIMADEENFDAAELHKAKSNLFKEITDHNKSLKVNCHDVKELIRFLQSLKVGDAVYKSIKTHYTILKLDPIPTSHSLTRLTDNIDFGEAQDSKGKIFKLNSHTFKWSAIYKDRPRSYNELKDPK